MSEILERTGDIDHAMLADQQNRVNVAAECVSVANELMRNEQLACNSAQDNYQAAVFNRGGDPHKLKLELENAARRLAVATDRADAARAELAQLHARTDAVRAMAHVPLYESHLRDWRDDVKRRDAAVAVLAGIDADIEADIAGMRACNVIGLQDIHGLLQSHELPKTARDLRAHFEARYIEWDDPRHPAQMPKERLTDEEARKQGLVKMVNGAQSTYVHPSAVPAHVSNGWKEI